MSIKALLSKNSIPYIPLKNKEALILIYFLFFILGISNSNGYNFYNEHRIIEVILLLIFGLWAVVRGQYHVSNVELLFFAFIGMGSLFWQQPLFIVTDLLLAYLLFKSFQVLTYNRLVAQIFVLSSLVLFLLLPVALLDYVNSGVYFPDWYPLPWNIRVYNSYFLIVSIFATWLYITEQRYRIYYLLFLFLAFFAILLDSGRSAALAYTLFIAVIALFHRAVRWPLLATYAGSFLAYMAVTYWVAVNVASSTAAGLQIARTTTSLRYDLWVHALECWAQNPIMGCGFYQLGRYEQFGAHPHNLFIQVLSETGIIGFGVLVYIMVVIAKRINWNQKYRYFIIAAFLAIGIELSLSGVYIYPITQIALLWLLIFLIKNTQFIYTKNVNYNAQQTKPLNYIISMIVYIAIALYFLYLFSHTTAFSIDAPVTPPRFWIYGYKLF